MRNAQRIKKIFGCCSNILKKVAFAILQSCNKNSKKRLNNFTNMVIKIDIDALKSKNTLGINKAENLKKKLKQPVSPQNLLAGFCEKV